MPEISRSVSISAKGRGTTVAMFVVGLALASFDNIFYSIYEPEFSTGYYQNYFVVISLLILIASSIAITASAFSYLLAHRNASVIESNSTVRWPLGKILSDTFFEQKKLIILSAIIYAMFFAFLDGILVYQPNVDFTIAYAVNGPAWRVVMCCGLPGYVPIGLLYLPSIHFGVELIPLSLMLMILVSTLVGLNVALLHKSYNLSRTGKSRPNTGIFGSIVGGALGLFVGCPTCAATFLLSMIAGTGSLAFAGLVSVYQPLIAGITIPLLVFSILWQANTVKNLLSGCTPLTRTHNAKENQS